MLYHIYHFLIAAIEMFCCMVFFDIFWENKEHRHSGKKACIVFCLSCVGYICNIFLSSFYLIRNAIVIITIIIVFKIYYKYNFKRIVILSLSYQGMAITTNIVAYVMIYTLSKDDGLIENYIIQNVLLIVFSKILLFLCIIIIKNISKQNKTALLSKTEWIRFFLFQIVLVVLFAVLFSLIRYTDNQKLANSFFITAICITGFNLMVFYMMKRDERKRQNILSQMQIQNEIEKYNAISESYKNQQKKVHEFKNQIMCIRSLLNDGEYEAALQYLNKINKTAVQQVHRINTNHVIVNAIINTKYQEACNKNIVVVFKGNDLSDIRLKNEDIVIILSNLLNNAIEACEQCKKSRKIKIKIKQNKKELIISVKNTYEQTLLIENGEYKTTKEKDGHGIGIKNVIQTVEKYHGEYAIYHDDNEFQFSIIIPI